MPGLLATRESRAGHGSHWWERASYSDRLREGAAVVASDLAQTQGSARARSAGGAEAPQAIKRFGETNEVAEAVVWLLGVVAGGVLAGIIGSIIATPLLAAGSGIYSYLRERQIAAEQGSLSAGDASEGSEGGGTALAAEHGARSVSARSGRGET